MTLALYGKSRKRQGSLLLAALLAIVAASIGGLALIGTAFAHASTITGTTTCNSADGTWTVTWKVDNDYGLVATIDDPSVNNGATLVGIADGTTIAAKSGGSNTFVNGSSVVDISKSSVTLSIETIIWSDNFKQNNTSTTIKRPSNCNPPPPPTQIIVQKTVDGANAPASSFPVTIKDLNVLNPKTYNGSIAVGSPYTQSLANIDDGVYLDNDDFTVTEGASSDSGWTTVGWAIISSTATCQNDLNGSKSGDGFTAGNVASAGDLNNIDAGETVVVCFKNQYNQPQVVNPSVKKVAHNPAISGGYALFDIIIDQPTTGAANITGMKIVDAMSDIQVVDDGTATCTNASGTLTCDVTTADATIQVKRAINASTLSDGSICLGGHIQNWITSASLSDNTVLTITEGGEGSKVTTTVPADNTACEGSQTIEKSDGVKDGNVIKWTITLHNSYPIAKSIIVYDNGTNASGTDLYSETCTNTVSEGPDNYYSCDVPANGSATIVLSTPAPVHSDVCQPLDLTNVAYIAASTTSGSSQNLGSDSGVYHEDASQSASCVTISKGDGVKDGSVIKWVVTLTNNSSVNQTVAVYDANSSFVSSTCLNTVSESPADTYSCTVPAKSQATITLSTAYSGSGGVCTGYRTNNTAWITGNQNASDTAEYSETSQPDESCLKPDKEKSQTSEPPTWNITVANSADQALAVFVKDAGATYQGATGGTCTATAGVTDMTAGIVCSVNANSTLSISVTKSMPKATCEGTDVSNSAQIWFGRTGEGEPDWPVDGGTFQDLGKNTELCNRQVTVTKYYQYVDGTPFSGATAADRPTFTMTPNPWTGLGTYNIVDDANCDLQDNGSNIVWTCTIPVSANPMVTETPAANWVQSFNGNCQLSLVRDLSEFAASALNVVTDEYLQSIGWFCNYPVGTIEIVKNDLTTAANTARPADWDFTATGPYSFSENRSIALGGGSVLITNVPLGNAFSAVENDGSYATCRTEGEAGIHQYFTTNISAGPTNLTQPGQKITFTFKNEDCGAVLGTGSLHIWKVRDLNANGVQDGGDSNIVWTVTVTGPEFPGGQVFNVPVGGLHLNGITEGAYTITEGSQFGYVLVGVRTTENGSLVASTSTSVTVVDNQEDTVTFYNQPLGQIPVHKNAFTSHNGGPNVPAPNDDDGWTITLTSVDCGINQVQQTNTNGDALFTNLPLCTDYVVKEQPINLSSPGFVPLTGDRFENITPNGVTLTFNNILRTQDCVVNCGGTTPTPTPTVPTATPTTPPSTAKPTNTPVPPTNTVEPTKTAVVGGEKTPGPGQPTPIAPSTGGGMLGGTAGGFNLLLVIAGLLALTSGVSFLALGRKNRR